MEKQGVSGKAAGSCLFACPCYMDDYAFTIGDLVSDILVVPARLGDFAVEDSQGHLVMPAQRYAEGQGTLVDLAGFQVSGTWHIRFHRARFTERDALMYGLLLG